MAKYGAIEHWAKIELPPEPAALAELQRRVERHYPVGVSQGGRGGWVDLEVLHGLHTVA